MSRQSGPDAATPVESVLHPATFVVVEAHARDFVNRSASDCDMRHEVTKTASKHCEVIRVSTHRWLKELRRRTVAWTNRLLAGQPCRPPRAIAKRPRVPPVCSTGIMFFSSQMLLRKKRRTERKARSLQHLKDPPLVNARVGAGKVCEQTAAIFGHASTMRKAAVSPSDVLRHLTLRDAPLYWVDAPYCPMSEVHGRSESFSSHNFTTSQNVMLQGIV